MAVTISASLIAAVSSFVILAVATYVSSGVFTESFNLGYAVLSAAITSIVWSGVTYLVSGVLTVEGIAIALGPLLAVIAYIIVTDVLYEGSIVRAAAISLGTWIVSFVILYAITAFTTYNSFEAIGVPPGL